MKTSKVKGARGGYHLELSEGACSVRIYTSKQRKSGRPYTTYRLVYEEGGVRQREGFGDLTEAKGQAQLVLTRLINGETAAQGLRAVEFQAYAIAKDEVAKVGSNVVDASREYRQARERLGDKGTIIEAVDYFLKHARPDIPAKKIPEIIAELLEAKKADKRSEAYLADLKMRLGKFAKSFAGAIGEVTTKEIETWLRSFGASSKNRNNYANAVTTLFNFARRYGYLPKERATAAEDLSRAKDEGGEVEIYTVFEIKLLLRRAMRLRPELVPYLAIGAFAGVRPAELLRLHWSEVDWQSRLIEIKGAKAKTAGRRHVPISDNLFAWPGMISSRRCSPKTTRRSASAVMEIP